MDAASSGTESSPLDLDELAWDADAFVVGHLGEEGLDELVAAMLDFEVFPIFLWARQPAEVAEKASSLADALRPHLEGRDEVGANLVEKMSRALVFDRDPAKGLLELATSPQFRHIPASLLRPPSRDSKVLQALPWLDDHLDNRGLLTVSGSMDPQPDVVFIGEWAIPYHQFLRRGFDARVNDALVVELLRLREKGATVQVAIDERRMYPRQHYRRVLEFDFWGGPHFTEASLDDPARRGADIRWHGWPSGAELLPWELDEHASVRTALDGTLRTIEIEEVTRPSLVRDSDVQLVRYVHALRDIERHVFTHVDGAVRFYDRDVYEGRRSARWPDGPSNEPLGRRKVFRADGSIGTSDWCEVVTQSFRGNRLVLEALAELGGSGE